MRTYLSLLAAFPVLPALPLLLAFKSCEPSPQWFTTCGDPVCEGYTGPTDAVALCTDQVAGDACGDEGAQCDPQDSCNALLLCATDDPTQQTGGCPISRRKFKHDIHYLSDVEQSAVALQARDVKLATWAYNWDPPSAPLHLGFIIDDNEGSYAIAADGDHVDLYGYTSLALAATQAQDARGSVLEARLTAQEARIAAQGVELAELRAALRTLEARGRAEATR